MKFVQKKDGSADIIFSNEEIKIITNTNKLTLGDEALRHFGNNLVKIVSDWNLNFNKKIQNLQTEENQEIISDETYNK
jgi:hypothetical protein